MNDSPVIEQDGSVAPRSKAEFPSGIRFGLRGSLDGDDMMQRALGSREAANMQQEFPEDAPRAFSSANLPAWQSSYSGMTITIKPGDIELGPDTVIEWGDITNASETVTAADESPTWFVWVNVDISTNPPTAEMYDGETITPLTTEQKLTIYQKRICSVTITNDPEDPTNDVINGIKVCQTGNITIPRAAG